MSLNRVSSLETFAPLLAENRSRRSSDASTRARKISFNPLPAEWDPPALEQIQAVGAFEVPKWKRTRMSSSVTSQEKHVILTIHMIQTVQVVVAVIYSLFAAGIVFGYAAIKPVLKREGAYRDVCQADPNDEDAISEDTCVEIHLNLMFTTAAVATNVAALPVGAILDRYGPRVCGLLGALSLAIGALFMSFENKLPFDGLLFGYLFLALGGPFTYISSFQLSNAFPKNSGLILALLTGAFDASSALFLVYRVIYERTNESFGHQSFFLAYLVVPAAIVVIQFGLMPAQSYKTVGELVEEIEEPIDADSGAFDDQIDEETALLHEEERQHRAEVVSGIQELLGTTKADKQARREERKNEISGVWGVMHAYTAWEQIKSPWFILICLFTGTFLFFVPLPFKSQLTVSSRPNDTHQLLRRHHPRSILRPPLLFRSSRARKRFLRPRPPPRRHFVHSLHRSHPRPHLHPYRAHHARSNSHHHRYSGHNPPQYASSLRQRLPFCFVPPVLLHRCFRLQCQGLWV